MNFHTFLVMLLILIKSSMLACIVNFENEQFIKLTGVPEFEVNRVQIRKHFEAQNSAERLAYKELEVSIDGFF